MDRKFIFKNFIPSSSTQNYCSRKFNHIWGASPSDSNILARVLKDSETMYRTSIEITASSGKFRVEAKDRAVLASIKMATDCFNEKMKEWRSSRFLADSL